MKKKKYLAILLCCSVLIGITSLTASAQTTIPHTDYRVFAFTFDGQNLSMEMTLGANNFLFLNVGDGVGSYYYVAPIFLGTYTALDATVGTFNGDISVFMVGITVFNGRNIIGIGSFSVNFANPAPFWFSAAAIN